MNSSSRCCPSPVVALRAPCMPRKIPTPPTHAPIHRRGTLVAVQPGAGFTAPPPVYIADHDTTPQQVVRNDPTSVLIRTLQNKKAKEEAKRRAAKAAGAGAGQGVGVGEGWRQRRSAGAKRQRSAGACSLGAPSPAADIFAPAVGTSQHTRRQGQATSRRGGGRRPACQAARGRRRRRRGAQRRGGACASCSRLRAAHAAAAHNQGAADDTEGLEPAGAAVEGILGAAAVPACLAAPKPAAPPASLRSLLSPCCHLLPTRS